MSILHTINKSPFTHTTLPSCLDICSINDSIIFIEDGVFGATESSPHTQKLEELINNGLKVYALIGDIEARGIQNKLLKNIIKADYDTFVKLSIENNCVQSWY